MEQFEVIIIGGGIVGATTACALGSAGMKVALVEARQQQPLDPHAERDPRVFAITRASERIFRALQAWDAMSAQEVSPFREMEVWDASGTGKIHFDCAELGEPCLGYIVEPRIIQSALWDRLQSLAPVSLFCPARFSNIDITPDQVDVALEDGRVLHGRCIVAADGVNSRVREHLGIHVKTHDYSQGSVVALVKTELDHRETAWQRFLPGGPLAFLPMRESWSSIVWTLPAAELDEVLALDKAAFHEALGVAFDFRLGRIVDSGARQAYPLRRLHAEVYVTARAALVGDAAHAIHPLAGQGVNLGLLDAASLAEVMATASGHGQDPGSLPVLRRYARWRRGDNLFMMSAMDGFNLLFKNRVAPLRWARNAGLSLVNAAPPVKQAFMRQAMGLKGDLPALARDPDEPSAAVPYIYKQPP